MLWTAPELLRMSATPADDTRKADVQQKADVYSYAIILQEILFRDQPFFAEDKEPKGTTIYIMG